VKFVKIECQAPLHERKAHPHKRKSPLLTTFWRRFCLWFCQRTFCNAPNLHLQSWWKTQKININILIAKVGRGLSPCSPPWLRLWEKPWQIRFQILLPIWTVSWRTKLKHLLNFRLQLIRARNLKSYATGHFHSWCWREFAHHRATVILTKWIRL